MSSDLRFGVVILVFARDQLFLVSLFEGLNLGEPPTKKKNSKVFYVFASNKTS